MEDITILNITTQKQQNGQKMVDWNYHHPLTIWYQVLELTKLLEIQLKETKLYLNFIQFRQGHLELKIKDLIGVQDLKRLALELMYHQVILDTLQFLQDRDLIKLVPSTASILMREDLILQEVKLNPNILIWHKKDEDP